MSKKTIISMIVIIAVIFGIYGVTKFAGNGVSADGEKIKITHKLGETEVTKNPSRVIVFDYGIADALNTLDVEIIGLPKSASVIPVARHNARAPAMLRPCVVVAERYLGIFHTPAIITASRERTTRSINVFNYDYGLTGSNQPYLSSVSPVNKPKKAF